MGVSLQPARPLVGKERLPAIDQLKGLAIVLILIYHGGGILGLPNRINGQIGVDIFLALSGFALALGSLELSARDFFRRRFLRIFPPYWAALALFIGLSYWVFGSGPDPRNVILHVLGLHGFGNDGIFFSWSDAFWYIGLIVPLYGLIFLIRRWADRLDVLIGVGGMSALFMCLYATARGYPGVLGHLPMRIPLFFAGVAAGRFAAGRPVRIEFSVWLLLGGYGLYHCLCLLPQSINSGIAGLGLIAAWLGFQALAGKVAPGRWLLGIFAFLGSISYELYLFHQPLMREYNAYFLAAEMRLPNPTKPQIFLGMVAVLAGLVILATLWRQLQAARAGRKENLVRPALCVLGLLAILAFFGVRELRPVHVVVRIDRWAALGAGACEPLVCIGRQSGSADLVYVRHEDAGAVRVGIDHWGGAGALSAPMAAAALAGRDLDILVSPAGITVSGPSGTILESGAPPHDGLGSVRIGVNDIGFTTALPRAQSAISVR